MATNVVQCDRCKQIILPNWLYIRGYRRTALTHEEDTVVFFHVPGECELYAEGETHPPS
jgi:hypothetical protein